MVTFHALAIFSSYAAFFLAVVTGLLFLAQEGQLKRKDPKILEAAALPLEMLDQVNLWAVVIGFLLLSAGMVPGVVLARSNWGAYFNGDPKEIWSLLTWAAYAGVLGLRLKGGLRGHRVILLSVMAFLLVLFTFVGVNTLLGGRHVFF